MSVSSVTRKQVLIGLPGTGKTTFLAAFWHVVTTNEVSGALHLDRLYGNRQHLNKIHNDWVNFKEMERTSQSAEKIVSMILKNPLTDENADLIFSDMSGESFLRQIVDRKWTKDFDSLLREASGVILFAHSYEITEPTLLDSNIEKSVLEMDDDEEDGSEVDEVDLPNWEPKNMPTQVQLVELLQFIQNQSYLANISKIAIVISAWDLVKKSYESPDEWLEKRLPLVDQYLKSNFERFENRLYGVSAQGDKLQGDLSKLQSYNRQSERIQILGKNCKEHDITEPVKWLMESD